MPTYKNSGAKSMKNAMPKGMKTKSSGMPKRMVYDSTMVKHMNKKMK